LIRICSDYWAANNPGQDEWVSGCWLAPTQQIFSYIMARTS